MQATRLPLFLCVVTLQLLHVSLVNALPRAMQVLLDLDDNAHGGEQSSQCDDVRDGAWGCKLHIPSPCKPSSMPVAAQPVLLDPAVQQQILKAQANMAELRRRAQEAAEISPPSKAPFCM